MNLHVFFPEGILSVEPNFPVSREIVYLDFWKAFHPFVNKVIIWATRWVHGWLESFSQNNY